MVGDEVVLTVGAPVHPGDQLDQLPTPDQSSVERLSNSSFLYGAGFVHRASCHVETGKGQSQTVT